MGSFPYAPGMVEDCGGGSPSGLIEKYLGEAYAKVLAVADDLPAITTLITNLAQINAVATAIANGADFTAWTWGEIVGTLTNQADLVGYISSRLTNYQPSNVNLAALAGLNMTGNGGRVLKVNIGGTGLEFDVDTGASGGSLAPADYGDITVNVDATMTVTHVGGVASGTLITTLNSKINSTLIGAANGVCPLDATSKIAAAYLPSYVDDVIEVATFASLPGPGETGKIYVTLDTNFEYRWSGSAYIRIVASPGTTDALVEGTTNLYFTNARAQAALTASLASKADLVGGVVPLAQIPASVPRIAGDGGMEIQRYVDFHNPDITDGVDYQARLQAGTGGTLDITTRLGLVTVSGSNLAIATNNKNLYFMGAAGNYSSFINQSDGNFCFYATHADGTPRGIWSVLTHSDTSVFQINPDVSMAGNLVVTGEITSPSDIRLKSDVVPLLNASEIVSLLSGYRFLMDGREQIGVIAQQVQKVLPELIQIDTDGWLSVNYSKLTAVLIADNNAMRARLNTMEARISRLEGR